MQRTTIKALFLSLVLPAFLVMALMEAKAAEVRTANDMYRLMEKNAMQLNHMFSAHVSPSLGTPISVLPSGYWSDFAVFCLVQEMPGGNGTFDCEFKDSTRLLAAHRSPRLVSKLSARERQALAVVQSRIRAIIRSGMSDYDKVKAVHDDIAGKADYDGNAPGDVCSLLLSNRGNCEAYARLTQLMMSMAGVPCHIVNGTIRRKHTWNMVYLQGAWYHIDVAWDDPVGYRGASRIRYEYFCVNDAVMGRSHRWDRKSAPASGRVATLYRH